jgi:hypothetical protein
MSSLSKKLPLNYLQEKTGIVFIEILGIYVIVCPIASFFDKLPIYFFGFDHDFTLREKVKVRIPMH